MGGNGQPTSKISSTPLNIGYIFDEIFRPINETFCCKDHLLAALYVEFWVMENKQYTFFIRNPAQGLVLKAS